MAGSTNSGRVTPKKTTPKKLAKKQLPSNGARAKRGAGAGGDAPTTVAHDSDSDLASQQDPVVSDDVSDEDVPAPKRLKEAKTDGNCVNYDVCKGQAGGDLSASRDYCDKCIPWRHAYRVTRELCEAKGADECVFCEMLAKKAKKKDIEYKNPEDGAMEMEPHSGKLQDDLPQGEPSEWKYFYNSFKDDLNVKIGDCVYLEQATANKTRYSRKTAYAMRVQYVIKDIEGDTFISGYAIYPPGHVKHRTKVRHEELYSEFAQMLSDVDQLVWAPLSAVTGTFILLSPDDLKEKGWPCGYVRQRVYAWVYDYDMSQDKVSTMNEVDYNACDNPILFKERKAIKGSEQLPVNRKD